jgi:hypothetical protein
MNERIRGLALKAMDFQGAIDIDTELKMTNSELAKFAELIVRECAELTLDHKNDDYYAGWLDYRDEIRRHFGVEE